MIKYLCIFLMCAGLISCATTGSNTKTRTVKIPTPEQPDSAAIASTGNMIEQRLGKEEGYKLYKSGPKQTQVKTMVDKLTVTAGGKSGQYAVYVADAGEKVNAMAIADNSIVVYQELMKRTKNNDQLAAVVAHEVAHILAKHNFDDTEQSRSEAVKAGGVLAGFGAAKATEKAGNNPVAAEAAGMAAEAVVEIVGEGAFVKSYSRKLEREADEIGMFLMAKACYDPKAAVDVWTNSAEVFGQESKGSFLSSHPSDKNRAKNLNKLLVSAQEIYNTNCQ